MDFVATQDFKSPYVISTGMPHKPTAIKTKSFKKGDIICGEIKTANGKPAFVLYRGTIVVPLSCVKQVITKSINTNNITSSADGENPKSDSKPRVSIDAKGKGLSSESKKKYVDAVVVGALVGFIATIIAEKKGWIATIENKNRAIGAGVGVAAGLYLMYRFGTKPTNDKSK